MDKNAFKERAKALWAERATHCVEVPEWSGKIHYKTPNLATLKSVMAESKGDPIEFSARIVVACAMDENGEKIWSKAEYLDLMKAVDPAVVNRIGNAIVSEAKIVLTPEAMADDEKN